MKRILAAALLVGLILPVQAADNKTKPFNWYCRHVTDGNQPSCDSAMQFIEEYDGYYIDK